jgi:small subunit ribosomal protein S23
VAHSPLSIAKQAKQLMDVGLLKTEPIWYQPILTTPPMTDLSRKPAQEHFLRPWNRANDNRRIQPISQGLAEQVRTRFYKEHPWELARPRVVVEEDGADYVREEWSSMEQVAKPLDGERYCPLTGSG